MLKLNYTKVGLYMEQITTAPELLIVAPFWQCG